MFNNLGLAVISVHYSQYGCGIICNWYGVCALELGVADPLSCVKHWVSGSLIKYAKRDIYW